jgi:hypothetical protein
MARLYRKLRTAHADVVPYTEHLAATLCLGCDLLPCVSGIGQAGNPVELDLELARAAWNAHAERVLEYASKHQPGQKVWALKKFGPPKDNKKPAEAGF